MPTKVDTIFGLGGGNTENVLLTAEPRVPDDRHLLGRDNLPTVVDAFLGCVLSNLPFDSDRRNRKVRVGKLPGSTRHGLGGWSWRWRNRRRYRRCGARGRRHDWRRPLRSFDWKRPDSKRNAHDQNDSRNTNYPPGAPYPFCLAMRTRPVPHRAQPLTD